MLGHLLLENHRQGLEQIQGLSAVVDVETLSSEAVARTLDDVAILKFVEKVDGSKESIPLLPSTEQPSNERLASVTTAVLSKCFVNQTGWFSVEEIQAQPLELDLQCVDVDAIIACGLRSIVDFVPSVMESVKLDRCSTKSACEVLSRCVAESREGEGSNDFASACSENEQESTIALWKIFRSLAHGGSHSAMSLLDLAKHLLRRHQSDEQSVDRPNRTIEVRRETVLRVKFPSDEENRSALWRIVLATPQCVKCTTLLTLETLEGDVAVVDTTEGQPLANILNVANPTCTFRGEAVISGVGCHSLKLNTVTTLEGDSLSWLDHQREAAKICMRQIAAQLIRSAYGQPMTSLCPFFEGCSAPSTLEVELPSWLQLRSDDWQRRIFPAVHSALRTCASEESVASYLKRRWRLDWVSMFQGDGNEQLRVELFALCEEVRKRCGSSVGSSDPAVASKTLQRWVRDRVTPSQLGDAIAQSEENFTVMDTVLSICETDMETSEIVLKCWTNAVSLSEMWSIVEGNSKLKTTHLRERFFSLFTQCSCELRQEILGQHTIDPSFLEAILRQGPVSIASGFEKAFNTFFTTVAGVRIIQASAGISEIERTSGTVCLKAIHSIPVDEPTTSYFEMTLGARNIKRSLIGFCCPQDSIEAGGIVRAEVLKRSWFLDSSAKAPHFIAFGSGDIVGVGVKFERSPQGMARFIWATLNGTIVFSSPLELPQLRDGSSSVTSIVPFVSWDATDRSNVSVNFGDPAFSKSSRNTSRNLLALAAQDPRLHAAVLDAMDKDNLCAKSVTELARSKELTGANASRLFQMIVEAPRNSATLVHAAATLLERGCAMENASVVNSVLSARNEPLIESVTFCPHWVNSSEESSQIIGPTVTVNEQQFLAHAVGTAIPSRGKCTFSVFIGYQGTEQKQVQNFGQFYLGVTALSAVQLSTSSWSESAIPSVWGVHSIASAQLRHCNDSAFAGDNYTFSANSVVTIEVDREGGTMSLRRSGKLFSHVFVGIPQDVELFPFVQLVDEKTSATLLPGVCSATISAEDALESAQVRIYRALLCSNETEKIVAKFLEECFLGRRPLSTALRIIGAEPWEVNVSAVEMPHCTKQTGVLIDVDPLTKQACLSINGVEKWFPLQHVNKVFVGEAAREPPHPLQDDEGDDAVMRVSTQNFNSSALSFVAKSALAGIEKWNFQHLRLSQLIGEEMRCRQLIEVEASNASSTMESVTSISSFKSLLATNRGLMSAVLQNAGIPSTHTFNPTMMSPQLRLPKHYRGKLVISPAAASKDSASCFTAIANEAINANGISNVRVRVEFDWMGLLALGTYPMSDGLYVGLCSEQFSHGYPVDFARLSPAQAWAVTSFDSKEWHLPNSCRLPTSANQIFSGDVLRLQVNREKGTLEVFRTPKGKSEASLGILFRDLPKGENLFPFVRISSARTAVLFLPEAAVLPRPIASQSRFAVSLKSKTHSCDGCLNQLVHSSIEAPNWYRCNECLDFDLCTACFQGHFHCGHTFTHMRLSSFIPSALLDARHLTSGAEVEICAAPLFPIRVENATFDNRSVRVTVNPDRSAFKTSGGVWGVIRKATSPVEIAAVFTSSTGSRDHRVIAGLAPLSLVENITLDELVALVTSPQRPRNIALFSSDSVWVEHTGSLIEVLVRGQCSTWQVGDLVAFQVAKDLTSIEVVKNGIACRKFSESKLWKQDDALAFFMITDGSSKVDLEVTTQQTPIMTGKIGELDSTRNTFRITNGVANRWCHRSQLTLPLEPIKQHSLLRDGLQVYLPQKSSNQFLPCVVVSSGDVDDPIRVHNGSEAFVTSLDSIFVPKFVNLARDPDDEHMYPDAKRRLRRYYAQYAPSKSEDDMDKAIELYTKRSSLKKMWEDLEKKYGPEPPLQIVLPPAQLVSECGIAVKDVLPLIHLLHLLLRFSESEVLRAALDSQDIVPLAPLLDFLSSQQLPAGDDNVAKWLHHIRVREGDTSRVTFDDIAPGDDSHELASVAVPPPLSAVNAGVALEGVYSGNWESQSLGLSFGVVVDNNRATIEFKRAGQVRAGAYRVEFPISSSAWNQSSQQLRLGLGAPDDTDAYAIFTLMCGDRFSKKCTVPLVLQQEEHAMFEGTWNPRRQLFEGEWRLTSGHRGHGELSPQTSSVKSAWNLPAPITVRDLTASPLVAATKSSDVSAIFGKTVAFLAMRLRLEWVEACLSNQSPSRLLRELAHSLPSAGIKKIIHTVTQLPQPAQLALFHRALWLSAQAGVDFHERVTAARIVTHLAPSYPDHYWSAVHALVSSVLLQWNSLDLLDTLGQLTKLVPTDQRQNLATAVAPLYHHLASVIAGPFADATYLSLAMEIFRPVVDSMNLDAFPVKGLELLADVAESMQQGRPLPLCLETWTESSELPLKWSPCGESSVLRGQLLVVGTVWSPLPPTTSEATYFEATCSENHVSIGCCSASDIASAATDDKNKKYGPQLGFAATSISFDGTCVYVNSKATRCGYAMIHGNETLGALVHVAEGWIQFSVNGEVAGRFPLPCNADHRAVVRCTTTPNEGCSLRSTPERLLSLPTGAKPLHGRLEDCSNAYSAASRSTITDHASLQQWADLVNDPQQRALSECFQRTLPFVDLSISAERGGLMQHFSTLKRMILPSLRKELAFIPPLETVERRSLPQVAVKWFELFSHHDRETEEALSRTVLSQLLRQLGNSAAAMQKDPMFVTALMMSESKHTPIDAGGPYSQVWSLVAEELMTDGSDATTTTATKDDGLSENSTTTDDVGAPAAGPKQKFHRNPLFTFGASAKGKVLVPERRCSSPQHLQLFTFFGAIMGYLLRSKRCLAVELSPIVWKHLTEEPLTATDFIDGVDASLQTSLQDDDFLESSDAEVVFPGLDARYHEMVSLNPTTTRRAAAEWALSHSLDKQLHAIREGFWSTLPRSTSRLLLPSELALKVCGEPFPSWEQLQLSITLTMPEAHQDMFWAAMKQLSPAEWSGFFYFASAQRRFPLSRKISVTPTQQSEKHIPQASTCFNHVSTPLYSTVEIWVTKLRQAISCQDMELA
ncbi:Hypothetical protein, putative [Bodo saltans]|uniref:B30.2/SPRY domain-containing protein n=1 Tax=Bodo saltans TaxID=75058 RepID=A0A0S4IHG8_BODSA|nr:Hypothetical protein, putative [Bodo saltans]|eukprot:CUE65115.1 Hypothetical protein, putative [Bodo saltans]